ncbi:hypothetical protein BKA70DRAFT_1393754 [Coprinopsis sp. MPI-PUGE-AT-0042]|nr:hypothetical protein BKA70DRAFT_1393754 [Coprinopsis sp. MPI-PUGE-AT-0042]
MAVEAPNTTGPFIAVIFVLILLPFSFAVYSFYNSRTDRQLRREERRRAQAAVNLELVRPILWEAWTQPAWKEHEKSCDALGSWNSIQPLWAKPEEVMPEIMTNTRIGMALEGTAPSGAGVRRRGEPTRRDLLSRSSLWWYLGLLAPNRPSSIQTELPTRTFKINTSDEGDSDIWKQDNNYQYRLQIGVVVALPSAPRKGHSGRNPDARMGGNVGEQVDCSTGYYIGTASCPIRIDAG